MSDIFEEEVRMPPQSLEAEQGALGAMLIDDAALAVVLRTCSEQDFYRGTHQQIYRAIAAVHERREPVDIITVATELRLHGTFEQNGGGEYLTALIGTVPTSLHAERYARIVAEKSAQRGLVKLGTQIETSAYEEEELASNVAAIGERLAGLTRQAMQRRSQPLSVLCDKFYDWQWDFMAQDPGIRGARLGIGSLDNIIGGFEHWELVIIKAEPKFGKTRLLRQSIMETALAGIPLLVYVLEGDPTRWLQGCVAYLANVPGALLDRGGSARQKPDEEERIASALGTLPALPIRLATELRTVEELGADILAEWQMARPGHKPQAVYIDYLQLLESPSSQSRTEEIKAALAMMLRVNAQTHMPFITASQVNVEHRTFYSAEAEHAASLVFEIQRGPKDRELKSEDARMDDRIRLINTHKRYGPMMKARELRADWPTGHFYDEIHDWQ